MPARSSTAEWQGDLQGGSGRFNLKSGACEGSYSYKSRFKDEGVPGSNPEELIAAAHASCFSMALANGLAAAGHSPESIRTTAVVHLAVTDDGPAISRIELSCEGKVPGIEAEAFLQAAEETKVACPVSRALAAVPIDLEARLV